MITNIYNKHKELWRVHRNTMLLVTILIAVAAGLISSIPVIGPLVAGLVVAPVIMAATYKAIQSEAPFSVGLVLEKIKDNLTMDVVSMQWSLTWRLFLWGLIPIYGLVKYYQYTRAFYIKLDNPGMGNVDCIRISQEDMNGRKWDYFTRRIMTALPLYLAIPVLFVLLVPVVIATAATSSNLGTAAGLIGIFSTLGIFMVLFAVIGFYYGAKLNHFELILNDTMEGIRKWEH